MHTLVRLTYTLILFLCIGCFDFGVQEKSTSAGLLSSDSGTSFTESSSDSSPESSELVTNSNLESSESEYSLDSPSISSSSTSHPESPEASILECSDGIDNDNDGLIDCLDTRCFNHIFCFERGTSLCNNGIDDDYDELVDCDEPACIETQKCKAASLPESSSSESNQGSSDDISSSIQLIDIFGENSAELCDDSKDNDNDGNTDCADSECHTYDFCSENSLYTCTDGIDNDRDDTADCDDQDCWSIPGANCGELTQAMCDDGIDNDNDGHPDCLDPDCLVFEICAWITGDGEGQGDGCGCIGNSDGSGGGAGIRASCEGKTLVLNKFENFTMTVYDHNKGTDFGNGNGADMLRQGMVGDKLIDGRPTYKKDLWNNKNIAQWWSEDYANSSTIVKIPFAKAGEATYSYNDTDFFPLDVGDAQEQDPDINYYFTGHMQWEFIYDGQKGQFFSISTNDDGFVYLNGNLVLDIGGVHTPIEDNFILDEELDKLGIAEGETITIDIFFAERQKMGSELRIQFSMPCIFKDL
ncbi:MAG: fibro-slime domain-containing protein [Fibrobacterales bacterium]